MLSNQPTQSYTIIHEFTASIIGRAIRICSKRGLPDWDRVTPAEILLAETIKPKPGERVLLMGCGHGALAAVLGSSSTLTYTDDNLIALQMTSRTLQTNQISATGLPRTAIHGPFDLVTIRLPKGRKLARRWLAEAHSLLRPGGACYLAGANSEGIQSVLKDAEVLFGKVGILAYKKGNRVGKMIKAQGETIVPGWLQEPGIAPGSWIEYNLDLKGKGLHFNIRSQPGVFSYDHLDEGTQLLLENLVVPPGSRVLDFGCGYGILGIATARLGAAQVDMVDVNLPAIASVEQNLRSNGICNGRVIPSDVLSAVMENRYDLIVSNPPFHTGQSVDYDIAQTFFQQAQTVLSPRGKLILVANRFIHYEQSLFGRVDVLVETSKFRVLQAIK